MFVRRENGREEKGREREGNDQSYLRFKFIVVVDLILHERFG